MQSTVSQAWLKSNTLEFIPVQSQKRTVFSNGGWVTADPVPADKPYLHKQVDKSQRWNNDGSYRCGQQNDDTSPNHVKCRAHEHLDDWWNGGVNGIDLLRETVHQISTGRTFKETHWRSEDIVQQVKVQVSRSKYSPYWHNHRVAKHSNTWKRRQVLTASTSHIKYFPSFCHHLTLAHLFYNNPENWASLQVDWAITPSN